MNTTVELIKGAELEIFCTEYLEHTGHEEDFLPGRLLWIALTNAAGIPYGSTHVFQRSKTSASRFVVLRYGLSPRHYSRYKYDGEPSAATEGVNNRVVAGWTGIRLSSAGYELLRAGE